MRLTLSQTADKESRVFDLKIEAHSGEIENAARAVKSMYDANHADQANFTIWNPIVEQIMTELMNLDYRFSVVTLLGENAEVVGRVLKKREA